MRGYLATSIDRYVHTLGLLPREPLRVLEIGGAPYQMTVLLKQFLGYDVHSVNEPGGEGFGVAVLDVDDGLGVNIPFSSVDIEREEWPFDDGSFDVVLYCEVIEHLTYDPTHTLVEAHRVLREGGTLLVTTPNALSWPSLVWMLRGRNFYPPYVGYGAPARHHRLFSVAELSNLAQSVGFDVRSCTSVYDRGYPHPKRFGLDAIAQRLAGWGFLRNRLDVIYLLATAKGSPRYAYPEGDVPFPMYTDVHAYPRSGRAGRIRVAHHEGVQLLTGFFDLEDWGGGVRWTAREVTFVLARRGGETLLDVTFYAGPSERGQVRGEIAVGGDGRHAFSAQAETWTTLRVPLPSDVGDTVEASIAIFNPFNPPGDDRVLGIAVRELGLS